MLRVEIVRSEALLKGQSRFLFRRRVVRGVVFAFGLIGVALTIHRMGAGFGQESGNIRDRQLWRVPVKDMRGIRGRDRLRQTRGGNR